MILKRCREGKPGEFCRGMLPSIYHKIPRTDRENELRSQLRQYKENLAMEQDGIKVNVRRKVIYWRAMELLTYGSLEGFEDILDHATSPQVLLTRGGWHLLWFLPCLLPLPDEFGAEEVWGENGHSM
ncbi:MAG TPA: hypothetical protein VKY59_13420, partial [Spirillospora sp.]|nr:hypothetical protein [Spirillospora sp.]